MDSKPQKQIVTDLKFSMEGCQTQKIEDKKKLLWEVQENTSEVPQRLLIFMSDAHKYLCT